MSKTAMAAIMYEADGSRNYWRTNLLAMKNSAELIAVRVDEMLTLLDSVIPPANKGK